MTVIAENLFPVLMVGTGLLTYYWYQQYPDSEYVLVDIADEMLRYDRLPDGGLFINYDQFCAEQLEVNHWFNSYWENHITNIGLTDKDIELWKERRKLDKECSVEQEITMLKKCGFKVVACVYSYQKFSVVVARK